MPILARALLEKRARLERLEGELGRETLLERHPEAAGYLRPREGYRLFDRRTDLVSKLETEIAGKLDLLDKTTLYPLATDER